MPNPPSPPAPPAAPGFAERGYDQTNAYLNKQLQGAGRTPEVDKALEDFAKSKTAGDLGFTHEGVKKAAPMLTAGLLGGAGLLLVDPVTRGVNALFGFLGRIPVIGGLFAAVGEGVSAVVGYAMPAIGGIVGYKMLDKEEVPPPKHEVKLPPPMGIVQPRIAPTEFERIRAKLDETKKSLTKLETEQGTAKTPEQKAALQKTIDAEKTKLKSHVEELTKQAEALKTETARFEAAARAAEVAHSDALKANPGDANLKKLQVERETTGRALQEAQKRANAVNESLKAAQELAQRHGVEIKPEPVAAKSPVVELDPKPAAAPAAPEMPKLPPEVEAKAKASIIEALKNLPENLANANNASTKINLDTAAAANLTIALMTIDQLQKHPAGFRAGFLEMAGKEPLKATLVGAVLASGAGATLKLPADGVQAVISRFRTPLPTLVPGSAPIPNANTNLAQRGGKFAGNFIRYASPLVALEGYNIGKDALQHGHERTGFHNADSAVHSGVLMIVGAQGTVSVLPAATDFFIRKSAEKPVAKVVEKVIGKATEKVLTKAGAKIGSRAVPVVGEVLLAKDFLDYALIPFLDEKGDSLGSATAKLEEAQKTMAKGFKPRNTAYFVTDNRPPAPNEYVNLTTAMHMWESRERRLNPNLPVQDNFAASIPPAELKRRLEILKQEESTSELQHQGSFLRRNTIGAVGGVFLGEQIHSTGLKSVEAALVELERGQPAGEGTPGVASYRKRFADVAEQIDSLKSRGMVDVAFESDYNKAKALISLKAGYKDPNEVVSIDGKSASIGQHWEELMNRRYQAQFLDMLDHARDRSPKQQIEGNQKAIEALGLDPVVAQMLFITSKEDFQTMLLAHQVTVGGKTYAPGELKDQVGILFDPPAGAVKESPYDSMEYRFRIDPAKIFTHNTSPSRGQIQAGLGHTKHMVEVFDQKTKSVIILHGNRLDDVATGGQRFEVHGFESPNIGESPLASPGKVENYYKFREPRVVVPQTREGFYEIFVAPPPFSPSSPAPNVNAQAPKRPEFDTLLQQQTGDRQAASLLTPVSPGDAVAPNVGAVAAANLAGQSVNRPPVG